MEEKIKAIGLHFTCASANNAIRGVDRKAVKDAIAAALAEAHEYNEREACLRRKVEHLNIALQTGARAMTRDDAAYQQARADWATINESAPEKPISEQAAAHGQAWERLCFFFNSAKEDSPE